MKFTDETRRNTPREAVPAHAKPSALIPDIILTEYVVPNLTPQVEHSLLQLCVVRKMPQMKWLGYNVFQILIIFVICINIV